MGSQPTYTIEELADAVASCKSFRQVLFSLGLKQAGGTQASIVSKCNELGLDTSHFHGQAWNSGNTYPERKLATLAKHLRYGSKVKAHALRLLLLETGTRPHQCERCEITEWNGVPAPLELHHVDGNKINNLPENLEILCPNCHAQTPNHAGKANRKAQDK